jgi:hypothetical protein
MKHYEIRRIFFAERETHAESSDVYTEIHKAQVRSAVTKLCEKKTSIGGRINVSSGR